MYRCYACDAPAEYNCACHTQVENPQDVPWKEAANEPLLLPAPTKLNVASGEDAVLFHVEVVD